MAAWRGGYDGTLYTREQVAEVIRSVSATNLRWVKHLTLHNTGLPDMTMEDRTPGGEAQRMRNAAVGYKKLGWPGAPPFWVFNSGKIGKGTPIDAGPNVMIHSPSWNDESISVEMVADFDGTDDPKDGAGGSVIYDTTAYLFAVLLKKLGLPANEKTIRFHKEDPRTTHDCPGKLVKKDEFIDMVKAYMNPAHTMIPTPPLPIEHEYAFVDTPGGTLNFRRTPGGDIKGELPHRIKVLILEDLGAWSYVQSPAGYKGYVFDKYLVIDKPKIEIPKLDVVDTTSTKLKPGSYKASAFCRDWCKRFESLMLVAYWDVNGYAIGYGHHGGTGVPPTVKKGDTITEAEAIRVLDADIALQEHYLNHYVNVPLTQGQVDALILHLFQQGPGNFREGKVRPLVNAERHEDAAAMIENWPTPNKGLQRRRAVEAQIYRGERPTRW